MVPKSLVFTNLVYKPILKLKMSVHDCPHNPGWFGASPARPPELAQKEPELHGRKKSGGPGGGGQAAVAIGGGQGVSDAGGPGPPKGPPHKELRRTSGTQ